MCSSMPSSSLADCQVDSFDSEDARYQAVDQAEIQRVARTYITPEACVVALVCPEEAKKLTP